MITENEIAKRPGLKHRQLQPCLLCNKGVMHEGMITFYRVQLERYVVDTRAVQRGAGMEMMMGGNPLLANVMGPDEDLAKQLVGPLEVLICEGCALRVDDPVGVLVEKASNRKEVVGQ